MSTRLATMALCAAALGCGESREVESFGVTMVGDTVMVTPTLSSAVAQLVLDPDLVVTNLTFPTDVAELDGGRFAVLDRLDHRVTLLDQDGAEIRRFGREGEGPGEFTAPYALSSSGQRLAVLDLNRRLTVFDWDGNVVGTHPDVAGDARTVWQRVPMSQWEEPLQMSREEVSRRLGALPSSNFGLLLQDRDERFDESFVSSAVPQRFPYNLLVVNEHGAITDTLAVLDGQELRVARVGTAQTFTLAWERPFARRPAWASGNGWVALGHGSSNEVVINWEHGRTQYVRWPVDLDDLGKADFNNYLDWELEAYRRTSGDVADQVSKSDREDWIEKELAPWRDRPQMTGLLGAGPCLALLAFRSNDGPLGESATVTIINLTDPQRSNVIRLRSESPGFLKHLGTERLYRVAVLENGTRVVERFPLPPEVRSSTVAG